MRLGEIEHTTACGMIRCPILELWFDADVVQQVYNEIQTLVCGLCSPTPRKGMRMNLKRRVGNFHLHPLQIRSCTSNTQDMQCVLSVYSSRKLLWRTILEILWTKNTLQQGKYSVCLFVLYTDCFKKLWLAHVHIKGCVCVYICRPGVQIPSFRFYKAYLVSSIANPLPLHEPLGFFKNIWIFFYKIA